MHKFRQKSYTEILNTRGTAGFDRNRNYDQNLSSRELNKNFKELSRFNDLNINKEIDKAKLDVKKELNNQSLNKEMGKVILKRKTYSVLGETGRGLIGGIGQAADSNVGKIAGAIGGWKLLGSAIGTLLGIGPVLGGIGGAVLGSKAVSGIGKGLQNASYS